MSANVYSSDDCTKPGDAIAYYNGSEDERANEKETGSYEGDGASSMGTRVDVSTVDGFAEPVNAHAYYVKQELLKV
eukprot:3390234-Alexandrium_andersonii.AAC.1